MKRIITISRQFGSGGHSIGEMVAKRLSYSFYDKDLIEKVAKESGFSEKYIEEQGEYSPSENRFSYAFVGRDINGMSPNDYLWMMQRKVIRELAEQEPCVIVGRCADYILRDRDDILNVFIHADMEKRAKRIVELYGKTDKTPEKRLREKDKKRKINYKYYTEQDWGMAVNYHLTLDSGEFGIEKCADIIVKLVQNTL